MSIVLKPIGIIHSPYKKDGDAPRQGFLSDEAMIIEIDETYISGLEGLKIGDDVLVLYWGDRSNRDRLSATPPGAQHATGVFSTRSPNRPNPIAVCVAKIIGITANKIEVTGLDALDKSPVLDVKIHIPNMEKLMQRP